MKQSSIEFLLDKFGDVIGDINTTNEQDLMLMEIIKQAKAMHEDEMCEFATRWFKNCPIGGDVQSIKHAQEYYKETFNTKEK